MRIQAWRIVKAKHADTAFSGAGAKMYGGRWNSPGGAVVYVAASISLATLETQVNVEPEELRKHYVLFEVTFEESLTSRIGPGILPKTWQKTPPPKALQEIGDHWLADGTSATLRIPSVIVPTEHNYLLNPAHPDFGRISIGPPSPHRFDRRLIRVD